jgi:hypothetical protein
MKCSLKCILSEWPTYVVLGELPFRCIAALMNYHLAHLPLSHTVILSSIVHTFFIENDAKILPVYYTWKVAVTNQNNKQSVQVKL